MESFDELQQQIDLAMHADRHRFRRQLRALEGARQPAASSAERFERLRQEIARSVALCELRREAVPFMRFDADLPVSARRDEIGQAIRRNQVVVVCGETGSGKSTQLPKICLELGRGVEGLIGHTQPRRIAARSVAARVAEELGSPLGRHVGFKVRFAESLGPQTYVKLMTDGILLAETQSDPYLDHYDTIILDEAHERSLNIDFLIGYLKRLLPRRPDLRLIITSATIDAARFSRHFANAEGPAPVVEVSGRTYPVEVLWRPPAPDEEGEEPDLQKAVAAAVDEMTRLDHGDILIFMPTERDIHETAKTLRGRALAGDGGGRKTEILPLYARLSLAEQQRVFQPGVNRRIVIATNVAESSLTVPRIRFVIDPGTARISRYSPRSKTQRLPIEPVSQASADQRRGRCGRVGPGVCVRLFSEEDYTTRDRYTVPEIQRTNLAAVILQTKALRLGDIEQFPFLDPPKPEAVRDGYGTLFELGAIDEQRELTDLGRRLSRLPVDPRIGRMILAAAEEGCIDEVLVIASALEVQDPRDRPHDKQEAADASHTRWADEQSDFLAYLKLWDHFHQLKRDLSRGQLQKACRQQFLSYNRMREWLDIHRELLDLVTEAGLGERGRSRQGATAKVPPAAGRGNGPPIRMRRPQRRLAAAQDRYAAIHRSILTGLLSSVAIRGDGHDYSVAGGGKANLWPGSGVFQAKPKWVVAAELVETTRRYLRTCAQIDRQWIEQVAGHLVKRSYSDLHWDGQWASAVALERVALFGLTIVSGRRVRYGPIDPAASRELLIQHGLVDGDIQPQPDFLARNIELARDTERLQAKLRRRDLLVSPWEIYEFYDQRLPAEIHDGAGMLRWLRMNPSEHRRRLGMTQADLLRDGVDVADGAFPDAIEVRQMQLPLEYQYEPGSEHDGVTVTVPLEAVNQLDPRPLEWLVPGLLEEKILAMIRSLPKALRTQFVPAPDAARRVLPLVQFGQGDFRAAVAAALSRIGGTSVLPGAFQEDRLPAELRMNVRVVGTEGQLLASGRDLEALRRELGAEAAAVFASVDDPRWHRDELTQWDFDELPQQIELSRGGMTVAAWPSLVDCETSVALRLADTPQRAAYETHFGLRRLFALAAGRELLTQIDWLPGLDQMGLHASLIGGFDLRRQMADVLADRAFLAEPAVPRNRTEFEAQLAEGRRRIAIAVQDVLEVMPGWFDAFHQARLALEQLGETRAAPGGALFAAPSLRPAATPAKWQYAVDDVRRQLDGLAGPRCLSTTPWRWLRHVPRYFRAVRHRLDALPGGGWVRDRQFFDEFQPRWAAYEDRRRQHESLGVFDPELVEYRWMLEEYRVSLFAQRLGTSMPISGKRLDQQLARVQG